MTLGEANVTGDASEVLPPAADKRSRASAWIERILFIVLCGAIGWFYLWTVRSNGERWNFGAEQNDYFNLLIDGWLDGQLHLKVAVPDALLRLDDPYDPSMRPPGVGLHDASFYKGRYYLYFGAAPVVVLMLPFRLITGTDLPVPAAVLAFTFAGFLGSAVTWVLVRRRYFPQAGALFNGVCLCVLATVGMGPVLVRRSNIWELPLSSGYCFAMLAIACVFQCLHAKRRAAIAWFATAGMCLGLAVASRPTYLFGAGLLLVPVARWWWQSRQPRATGDAASRPLWLTLAGGGPLLLAIAAIVWHNYARFGNPLEFGVRYQLSSMHEWKVRHFSIEYVPFNLALYLFQPAAWSRYFPFFQPAASPVPPKGYFGYEEVFGLLTNAPVLILAALAVCAIPGRRGAGRETLGVWLAALAVLAAGMVVVLSFFYAAMGRYAVDFAPTLALLSCVGAAACEEIGRRRAGAATRLLLTGAIRMLMLFSIFFAVMLSMRLYGNLRRLNPVTYASVARVCNYPAHLWERLSATKHGPLELTLRFRAVTPGTREPLVTTGWRGAEDRIFVQHETDGAARIGYAHDEGGEELSRRLRIAEGARHRLRIEMGSLYPPEEHPFFARFTPAQVERLARRLIVFFDDHVVLDKYQRFHVASPATLRVGRASPPSADGKLFSGDMLEVRRDPDVERLVRESLDRCTLRVLLGPSIVQAREPLFTTTDAAGAAVWFVTRRGASLASIGCAWAEEKIWESEAFAWDFATPHQIEFSVVRNSDPTQPNRASVKLDRTVVSSLPVAAPFNPSTLVLGKNETRFTGCAPILSGSVQRVDFDAIRNAAGFDRLELELLFPAQPTASREPMVVTGQTGRADLLFVEYVANNRIRFRFDHWGKPPLFSPELEVDRAVPHRLEISLGSFPRTVRGPRDAADHVELRLDGFVVWRAPSKFYAAEPADIFVGHNPMGSTASAEFFSGTLLNVRCLPVERQNP